MYGTVLGNFVRFWAHSAGRLCICCGTALYGGAENFAGILFGCRMCGGRFVCESVFRLAPLPSRRFFAPSALRSAGGSFTDGTDSGRCLGGRVPAGGCSKTTVDAAQISPRKKEPPTFGSTAASIEPCSLRRRYEKGKGDLLLWAGLLPLRGAGGLRRLPHRRLPKRSRVPEFWLLPGTGGWTAAGSARTFYAAAGCFSLSGAVLLSSISKFMVWRHCWTGLQKMKLPQCGIMTQAS